MRFAYLATSRKIFPLRRNLFTLGAGLLLTAGLLPGQTLDISGGGGIGAVHVGNGDRTSGGAAGFSVGWPSTAMQKFQFDFLYVNPRNRRFDSRFVTGSYVVQQSRGVVRPFFQLGIGVELQKVTGVTGPPPGPPHRVGARSGHLAGIVGGGVTFEAAPPLFIRPEIRTYVSAGTPSIIMPMVSMGWTF